MLNVDMAITACYGEMLVYTSSIDEVMRKSPCQRHTRRQG